MYPHTQAQGTTLHHLVYTNKVTNSLGVVGLIHFWKFKYIA